MRRRFAPLALALSAALLGGGFNAPVSAADPLEVVLTVREPDGSVALTGSAQAWEVYRGADGAEYVRHRQTCQVDVMTRTCSFHGLPTGTYVFDTGSWESRDGTTRTFYDATSPGTADPSKASRVQVTANDGIVRDLEIRRERAAVAFVDMTNEAWRDGSWTALASFPNPLRTEGQPTATPVSTFVDEGHSAFYALPAGLPITFSFRPDSNQDFVQTYLGDARRLSEAKTVTLSSGETTRLKIVPQHRPTLRGTVQIAGGGDVTKLTVQGWMLRSQGWSQYAGSQPVQADGSFVMPVPAGRWRLEVRDASGVFNGRWYHNSASLSATDDIYIDEARPTPLDPIVLGGTVPGARPTLAGITATAPPAVKAGDEVPVDVVSVEPTGGTVQVLDGDRLVGTGTLVDGKAIVQASGLSAGSHTLRVYFAGTDARQAAYTPPVTVAVLHPATVSAKAVGALTAGRPGEVSVDVASPGLVPTGSVTIKDGAAVVGRADLRSADRGTVRVPVSGRPAGSRQLTVQFSGSTEVAPADTVVRVTVAKAAPSVTAKAVRPLVVGTRGQVVVTATAPGLTATGTVTVKDGSTVLGRGVLSSTSRGSVRVSIVPRVAGARSYTVVYAGSGDVATRSVAVRIGTAKARAVVTTAPQGAIRAKRVARLSVRVTAPGVVPTGRVVVRRGSRTVGVATLTAKDRGRRTVVIKGLPKGRSALTVTYSGSAQVSGATAKRVVSVR